MEAFGKADAQTKMTQAREGLRHRRCAAFFTALFVGRLDWIRTNDPHHVKVVL
jgi:hypothetical protein